MRPSKTSTASPVMSDVIVRRATSISSSPPGRVTIDARRSARPVRAAATAARARARAARHRLAGAALPDAHLEPRRARDADELGVHAAREERMALEARADLRERQPATSSTKTHAVRVAHRHAGDAARRVRRRRAARSIDLAVGVDRNARGPSHSGVPMSTVDARDAAVRRARSASVFTPASVSTRSGFGARRGRGRGRTSRGRGCRCRTSRRGCRRRCRSAMRQSARSEPSEQDEPVGADAATAVAQAAARAPAGSPGSRRARRRRRSRSPCRAAS